jgi:hypothetical protein
MLEIYRRCFAVGLASSLIVCSHSATGFASQGLSASSLRKGIFSVQTVTPPPAAAIFAADPALEPAHLSVHREFRRIAGGAPSAQEEKELYEPIKDILKWSGLSDTDSRDFAITIVSYAHSSKVKMFLEKKKLPRPIRTEIFRSLLDAHPPARHPRNRNEENAWLDRRIRRVLRRTEYGTGAWDVIHGKQRDAFFLDLQGLTDDESAAKQEAALSTVKNTLRDARIRLRAYAINHPDVFGIPAAGLFPVSSIHPETPRVYILNALLSEELLAHWTLYLSPQEVHVVEETLSGQNRHAAIEELPKKARLLESATTTLTRIYADLSRTWIDLPENVYSEPMRPQRLKQWLGKRLPQSLSSHKPMLTEGLVSAVEFLLDYPFFENAYLQLVLSERAMDLIAVKRVSGTVRSMGLQVMAYGQAYYMLSALQDYPMQGHYHRPFRERFAHEISGDQLRLSLHRFLEDYFHGSGKTKRPRREWFFTGENLPLRKQA